MFKRERKFGDLALKEGYVTKEQLANALKEQEEARSKGGLHRKLANILIDRGYLDIDNASKILMKQQRKSFRSWIAGLFGSRKNV